MKSRPIGFWDLLRRLVNLLTTRNLRTVPDPRSRRPASVFFRHVDAGSCNDCEVEIRALGNPIYDLHRYGMHIVASPHHADVMLVTGPFVRSMEAPALAAFRAMPEPCRVVTVGDGLGENLVFRHSYAVVPLPAEMAAVCVDHIPGDPPSPSSLLDHLLALKTE